MIVYLKAIFNLFKNYHFYALPILLNEIIFNFKHDKFFNKIKILNSNSLSDSIPCPYFFLQKIEKFIKKKNIKIICDLGSGYGKIIYFFGKYLKYKIDGVELDREIFDKSKKLADININIINKNILNYDLSIIRYDLLILNDPLKKLKDFQLIIKKIRNLKHDCYVVLINITLDKANILMNNLEIIKIYKITRNKNIYFCKKLNGGP
tara:strand:- start:29 stop:649 length:621 start_codon:yes stop_codon:yes gene_type:complete